MRITGGIACGRRLAVPPSGVRPSLDRFRESLFSMLAPHLPGARVLDLFAGSGALGLEAWSRGAAAVCWVEHSARAFRTLRANVDSICGTDNPALRCIRGNARTPARFAAWGPFSLVLADPPYEQGRGGSLARALLQTLSDPAMLAPGGFVAIEQSSVDPAVKVSGWRMARDRAMGQSRIAIYRMESGAEAKETR